MSKKWYSVCSVRGCTSKKKTVKGDKRGTDEQTFFCFPKSQSLSAKWIQFCDNEKLKSKSSSTLSNHYLICDLHFSLHQMIYCVLGISKKKRLKPNMIPELCPPPPVSLHYEKKSSNLRDNNKKKSSSGESTIHGKNETGIEESSTLSEIDTTLTDINKSEVDDQTIYLDNKDFTNENMEYKNEHRDKEHIPKLLLNDFNQSGYNNMTIGKKLKLLKYGSNLPYTTPVVTPTQNALSEHLVLGQPKQRKLQPQASTGNELNMVSNVLNLPLLTLPVVSQPQYALSESIVTTTTTPTEQPIQSIISPKKKLKSKNAKVSIGNKINVVPNATTLPLTIPIIVQNQKTLPESIVTNMKNKPNESIVSTKEKPKRKNTEMTIGKKLKLLENEPILPHKTPAVTPTQKALIEYLATKQAKQKKLLPKESVNQKNVPSFEERFKRRKNIVKSRDGSGTYYSILNRRKKRTNNESIRRIYIEDVMEALHDILPPFLRICLEFQLCKFRNSKPVYQYQMKKLSATLLAHMGKRAYEVLTLMTPLQDYKRVRRNMENPKFKPDIDLFKMDGNEEKKLSLLTKSLDFTPEDTNHRYIRVDHSDEELSDIEDIDEEENDATEDTELINWLDGDLEDELDESEEEYQSDNDIVVQFNIPQENIYSNNVNGTKSKCDVVDVKNVYSIKQEDEIETFIEEEDEKLIIYPEYVIDNDNSYKPKLKDEADYSSSSIMPLIDFEDNAFTSTTPYKYKSSKHSRLNYENR